MRHLGFAGAGGLAASLAVAAAACLENLPRPSGPVASLTVAPDSTRIAVGDSVLLAATARNDAHEILPGAIVSWASRDPGVATVTGLGLVRAVAAGGATIVASADGAADSARVTVIPRLVRLRIAPPGATMVPGGALAFAAYGVDATGASVVRLAPVWATSDTTIIGVSAEGAATARREGTAWLTAREEPWRDSVPMRVTSARFTVVSAGPYQNTCATGPQGAFCWGYEGNAGNLGLGALLDAATTPTGVVGGAGFTTVSTGDAFTCALAQDGTPWCWGNGAFGRLGDGTTDSSRGTPAPASGAPALVSLSAGRRHVCGLTATGEAWCWGGNSRGALGVPLTIEQSAFPLQVATEQPFATIHAGYMHSCGLAPDGAAWCWGRGTELGDSVAVTRSTPAPVYGGHRFRSLSVGWVHSCGLATDDRVYCWGYGPAGELGRYTDSVFTTPVPLENGPALVSVTAGYYTTCGLTADGSAWCWGWNNAGQLGTGDTVGGPTPRPVAGGLRFTSLSSGFVHTCGIATDGLLYCWGAVLHGMLGEGSDGTGTRLTPFPVVGQAAVGGRKAARP